MNSLVQSPTPEINTLADVIRIAGGPEVVAITCGITSRAVYKWTRSGCLPRTEFSNETDYADRIAKLTDGQISKETILKVGNRRIHCESTPS